MLSAKLMLIHGSLFGEKQARVYYYNERYLKGSL